MTVSGFIIENYIMLFSAVGLLIMLSISAHINTKIKRYTMVAIILLILTCVIQNVEVLLHDVVGAAVGRYILTTLKYILHPTIILTLLPIMSPFDWLKKTKWKIIITIPLMIASILYITSFATHLICWFDTTIEGLSIYNGGPLSALPYYVFIGYYVFLIIQQIIYLRNFSLTHKLIISYILVGASIGLILYITLCDYDNYTGLLTASLLLVFLFFYITQASIDNLTTLRNRQAFYQDTSRKIAGALVSVDMNELKYINDTFGHEKGDEALRTIGHILQKFSGSNSVAYRIGGDEFVILYSKATEDDINIYISIMKDELEKVKYSCAFGYSMKNSSKTIQDMLVEADTNMYKNKLEIKQKQKGIHMRD